MVKDKIGIFDSGIGGLSVWTEVVRLMPNHNTVYYADSANCPYGGKDSEEIFRLTEKGVKWLMKKGAGVIIIACNTATGAAIEKLREKYPDFPFIGIEPAIKIAAERTKSGTIAIMATKYTLQSEKYKNTKKKYSNGCRVLEQAGEGLVELAETDKTASQEAEKLLREYLIPLADKGADQLVLGCTHYPFFMETIRRIVGSRMEIIDPAPYVAKHAFEIIEENCIPESEKKFIFHSTLSVNHSRLLRKKALKLI